MGVSIGVVGLGSFGGCFAPLFKNHPLVSRIGLCDREPERIAEFANDPFYHDKLHPRDCFDSLDAICRADFDALVIITQPWLHAPQCIQAMDSGKDVYSAVPIISIPDDDEILDWCDRLVATVKRTGQRYMLGETTYYHPQSMFCRRQARQGAFGDFVYAEGEYMHDVDSHCNLREVQRSRTASASGKEWLPLRDAYRRRGVRGGPMHYPTHSVSGPVCVMNAHAVKVNAHGFRNREDDPFFAESAFSNEMALFAMSNGAAVRILEMRETPGLVGQDSETFRVFGTHGAFSENRWFSIRRPDFGRPDAAALPKPEVTALTPAEMFDPLPPEVQLAFKRVMHRDLDEAKLLSLDFTPRGHGGSHPYLVHEFISAVAERRQPAINIWEAVRYMAMGVAAHQSALEDGETVTVPDWGDAPA
ncbi:MAG: Glycosyl hydrolase family 109 protein 1 precursor [Lentisphaerae bacterium ADurb.BinA184]|nr:MAG: Glycosyl hydrolase family 109 protein 1 precursor [Lentisphaerae bacterium ADurb.BinA184]